MSQRLEVEEMTPDRPPSRVVVLFRPGGLSLDAPEEELLERSGITSVFATRFRELKLTRIFNREELNALTHLVARARELEGEEYEPFDFETAFYLDANWRDDFFDGEAGTFLDGVTAELRRLPTVQEAYVDRPAPDPVIAGGPTEMETVPQYLGPAPRGIDAFAAWQEGFDGSGQRMIDIERGWTFNHEGILAHGISNLTGPIDPGAQGHGTSVLGILCAERDGSWPVGIAPRVSSVRTTSYGDNIDRPHALLAALLSLRAGETLLIEVQVYIVIDRQFVYCPVEVNDLDFALLRLGTALGIIVVEAGGNGRESDRVGIDFDAYRSPSGRLVLRRDVRDSKAILVTACDCTDAHERLTFAPYGGRLDCFAWGESILTLDSVSGATQGTRQDFGGTSGAAAIIAGITLLVQQWAEASFGRRLVGASMRQLLSDPAMNTQSTTPDKLVGVMPNLRAIMSQGLS
jgi:hypothetical protein